MAEPAEPEDNSESESESDESKPRSASKKSKSALRQIDAWVSGIEDMHNPDNWDQDDGPSWQFNKDNGDDTLDSVFTTPQGYIFCPAPHCMRALHIFTKHFCEHPLLPGRNGRYHTAKEIRDNAVHEMYMFCYQRGLRELWGYM